MLSAHVLISHFAVLLTLIGYALYISDIIKGKTKPHAFTWLVFTVAGFTAYGLQVVGGGGVGTWSLLVGCVIALLVFLMSLKWGTKDIKLLDIFFLFLSGVALFLWLVVDQPIWSAILATSIEILGLVPTVRKSWNNPYSETLLTYQISIVRFGVSIFALQAINILTVIYPAAWLVANIIVTVILVTRRRVIGRP